MIIMIRKFPSFQETKNQILLTLYNNNFKLPTQEVYKLLTQFYDLSEGLLNRKMNDGRNKWKNVMQSARARLVVENKVYSAKEKESGYWELTELGKITAEDLLEERVIDNEVILKGLSQSELEKRLERKKLIGNIGEEIVLNKEKELLLEHSLRKLSESVKRVSVEDCRLGYDILSYNLDGSEKYIEVKSSEKINNEFYLTSNELTQLNKYKEKYSIYLVQGIHVSNKTFKNIIQINNPEKEFENNKYSMKAISWRVAFETDK